VPCRKKDGCRASSSGHQGRAEVDVGGDIDAVLGIGAVEDLAVAGRLEVVLATLNGVVASASRRSGYNR
jgi:hypothetical protein